MRREDLADLAAFAAVAKERSFTKAAARLGVSQSALSQTIRAFEERLGVRLLTRTTRSVAPTEAGARLARTLEPRFDEIEAELATLRDRRDRPAGLLRITAGEHPAMTILEPAVARLLAEYPDIQVEIVVDFGLTDIVAQGFDAGVRLGEQVAKDMIAMRISSDIRMAVVASPGYLAHAGTPETPQDLTAHTCINLRLPTHGNLFVWEFERSGRELKVKVEGQMIVNTATLRLQAALNGVGIAYMPEDLAEAHIESGHLVRMLEDWCPRFDGYHLYYPHRRRSSAAFNLLLDALRYRGRDI